MSVRILERARSRSLTMLTDLRVWAVVVVVDLLALWSIWRSREYSRRARVVWTLIVAMLPILGALAWFPLGRERRRRRGGEG